MNIDTSVRALNMAAKYPAQDLLRLAREKQWNVEQVETTVGAMAAEIHRLKGEVAAVMVDKDHQVRAASERALDCTEHGKVIDGLEKQVYTISQSATAHDKARGHLAVGLREIRQALERLQAKTNRNEPLPSSEYLVNELAKAVAKLSERGRVK